MNNENTKNNNDKNKQRSIDKTKKKGMKGSAPVKFTPNKTKNN